MKAKECKKVCYRNIQHSCLPLRLFMHSRKKTLSFIQLLPIEACHFLSIRHTYQRFLSAIAVLVRGHCSVIPFYKWFLPVKELFNLLASSGSSMRCSGLTVVSHMISLKFSLKLFSLKTAYCQLWLWQSKKVSKWSVHSTSPHKRFRHYKRCL